MKKQINASVFQQSLSQVGLNAATVAKKLGVSREAVSKWQRGDSFPRPDKLLRLGMILNQPYQALVQEPMAVNEPRVAYRAKANRKTTDEHINWAKDAGIRLRGLVPYLPEDRTRPPVLKAPQLDYNYVQKVAAEVREEMGVTKIEKISIQHFLDQFQALDAVLIPVFWGEQKQHGNAMHAYLPDSMTTWVWLNLDSKMHDFMFWMAHELGHAYSPDLGGDEAEDFADLFAQCLLFPDAVAKKVHRQLFSTATLAERWSTIASEAKRRMISPYTIIKALESYSIDTAQSKINFGRNYGAKLTRFNKNIKTIAEFLFNGIQPEPAEYIATCSKVFGTPFFNALAALSEENELTPPFLVKTMDVSLIDAKALCRELA